MTNQYGRIFNQSRKDQGFHSQAHLDAFYAYMDHRDNCAECKKPGPGVILSDGFQPTMNECDTARELLRAEYAIKDAS